jgi:acyl-CoA thioesterase I
MPDSTLRSIFLRSSVFPPGSWLGEPYLTDETGIHPNAEGNKILAAAVAKTLQQRYGDDIWRSDDDEGG